MSLNVTMNSFKMIVSAFVMMIGVSASAEVNNMMDAVNKAGKQRMLTQRMFKDYVLVGMNNTYGNPKEDLSKMIKLFDKDLSELQKFIKDKPSLQSLKKVETLWKPIKKSLQETPAMDKASALQTDLEILLQAADNNTKLIAKASKSSNGEIVNIAGKQRMLSQRMASLYMLQVWGVKDPSFTKKLYSAMDEFTVAQKKLIAFSSNTDEINAHLKKSAKAFKFFEMMGKSKSNKYIPSLINRSANKILVNMNAATNLYSTILSSK